MNAWLKQVFDHPDLNGSLIIAAKTLLIYAFLIAGLLTLRAVHHQTVFWFVLVWGATANLAAVIGMLQARLVPRAWAWEADCSGRD